MANSEQKQDIKGSPLSYWEFWQHVAPGMLKEIKGGNLNGKTDINPVWRFRALTEAFGPCGFGWTVSESERWTNECAGEVGAFVKVELRINIGGTWSEPIEGVGGSKLCGKGRGDGINDEAWKMATTDAISVACKALGMAADVYTGRQSHKDQDQQKTGGDYGSKYESRNYGQISTRNSPAGNYTTQPLRAQNSPIPGPATGTQAPAPAPRRRTVTLAAVEKGQAKRLITELSQRDYDDMRDWADGLEALKKQYDYEPAALDRIQQLAVEERNARHQQQVPPTDNLPL